MPTQSLQGGIHGGFPSGSPRRSGLDDVGLAVDTNQCQTLPASTCHSHSIVAGGLLDMS
jgi:hypothetical protein